MDEKNIPDTIEGLRAENEELRKLNSTKSEWISIAAHQLRTSLSAIKWILKMFLDGDFGSLSSEQQGFMKKAYENNDRMVLLVNEMLSLNHTEDSSITYTMRKEELVSLIDETIFDFHGESFKKGIELIFLRPEDSELFTEYDKEKIRVVLQNLIENSIKYSTTGDRVFVGLKKNGDEVEISIKDTGIGIPATEQPKIFEKFYRATNAKEKEEIGSGLGLYTIKQIVEHHKGKIWFESEPEKGSTFYFTLPISS
ncbi:MAG: HAMP domain-containing histidine kinase [Candidatus Pacebacteria bacterium]|nr:HAMP domain-containing histidine kinase [Candidatus Paceibacterota bacterium]MBP9058177.1 HAMP domain-containing histidine kinase [Candidatus Paceibacterota bacterium]MBP9769905.1 HAMP domain-containing histidine kinase [Candidatus Paceibacterota bacterium]